MIGNRANAGLTTQLVLLGSTRAERDQILVPLDTVEDDVKASGQALSDKGLPDAALDAPLSRSALAVLEAHLEERQEIHLRIHVGDSVQQHRRLVRIPGIAGQCECFCQSLHTGLDLPPHGIKAVVRDHVVPLLLLVEHPVPIIHVELVQWISWICVVGVEKECPVTKLTSEHAVLVQRRLVECLEVVFRIDLTAIHAGDLPRSAFLERPPGPPVFLRRRCPTSGAEGLLALRARPFVRIDRSRELLWGYRPPQRLVSPSHPFLGLANSAFALFPHPVVLLRIYECVGTHLGGDESAV